MPLTWIRDPITEQGTVTKNGYNHGVSYTTAAASLVAALYDPPVVMGGGHPDAGGMTCCGIVVNEINAPAINGGLGRYRASCTFTTETDKAAEQPPVPGAPTPGDPPTTPDPILGKPYSPSSNVIESTDVVPAGSIIDSYYIEQVPTDVDIDGVAIMTSSKEPVNPPPMMPVVVTNIRLVWYAGADQRGGYEIARNKVNDAAFRGSPARHAYCSDVLSEKIREATDTASECWKHEALITQKSPLPQQPTGSGPFDYVFVDMGYHELNKEVMPNVNRPKLLNGSGSFQNPQNPAAPIIKYAKLVSSTTFNFPT